MYDSKLAKEGQELLDEYRSQWSDENPYKECATFKDLFLKIVENAFDNKILISTDCVSSEEEISLISKDGYGWEFGRDDHRDFMFSIGRPELAYMYDDYGLHQEMEDLICVIDYDSNGNIMREPKIILNPFRITESSVSQ